MKILLVQETDWFERGPLQQNHLMEKLSLKGHEIRVIDHEILWNTCGKKELYSRRKVFNNVSRVYKGAAVTIVRPPILKFPHLDYVSLVLSRKKEIDRQIREFSPDVVVGFYILNAYLAMKAAKKKNRPFIYYWIDVYHAQIPFRPYQSVGEYIEKKILKNADRVVVINEELKDFVIKMGSEFKRTHVEKAGVDFDRFNPEISGNKVREKYKIKKDDVVLFFVGVLYNFSGLKEVATELSKIKDEKPNIKIKLLIVGDGDAFDDLQKIREEYYLDGQIILACKQPYEAIPAFIASSDICLLPAHNNETMRNIVPIKLYEYMACGKPVIATKLPGVMKEFGEGHGVIYVDKPEDVVKKAIELIENGRIKEEGRKARTFVEKYNWDDIVADFEGVLEEVIRGG